ncbi:autotransporter-associated N-terminal domain-containing protein, partial [Leptotrichia trevisanii]
ITFLVTGLLTFAPRLHADVEAEQQEVSAQTYDAITDLRQSFIRARKENEKSLKGAERELAMLLQQGDQVIKSPWASFQFGTGFANNDWGTTYRGRGGKFLEYYRRDNDLTKYVFDANKNAYGATKLHVSRNQEPDALTINPANVYKAYEPTEVTKMDAMTLPNAPELNPEAAKPPAGYYGRDIPYRVTRTFGVVPYSTTLDYEARVNNNINNNSYKNENNVGNNTGTFNATSGKFYNTYGYNATDTTQSDTSTAATGGFSNISGEFFVGGRHNHYSDNGTWPYYALNDSYYRFVYVDSDNEDDTNLNHLDSGYHGHDETWKKFNLPSNQVGGGVVQTFPNARRGAAVLANKNLTVKNSIFNIAANSGGDGTRRNLNATSDEFNEHNGINVVGSSTLTVNGNAGSQNYYYYVADSNGVRVRFTSEELAKGSPYYNVNTDQVRQHGTDFYIVRRNSRSGVTFNIQGGIKNNAILSNSSGKTDVYHTSFTVSGSYNNGINMLGTGKLELNDSTFDINGNRNTAVSLNGGATGNTVYNSKFTLNGTYGTGVALWKANTKATNVDRGIYKLIGENNNGIFINTGTTVDNALGNTFTIDGNYGNGIYVKGTLTTVSKDTSVNPEWANTFNVNSSYSNGIYADTSSNLGTVSNTTFNINGGSSNGILKNTNTNTTVSGSVFNVSGAGSTGITYNGGSTAETIEGSTFNINGGNTNTAGVHMINIAKLTVKPNTDFYVNGHAIGIEIDNNGIQNKEIEFTGSPGTGWTHMTLTGGNNIGINIRDGVMNSSNREVKLSGANDEYGLDMTIMSDNNVGYLNRTYADKLTVISGKDPININSSSKYGRVKVGSLNSATGYNNNIVFANLGYVKDGEIKLRQIEVDGNSNTIAYFRNGSGDYFHQNGNPTNNSGVGFFKGSALELQGIIGRNFNSREATTGTSTGNVGIYASSGQRKGIHTKNIGETNSPSDIGDLKVTNLNIGVGPHAVNTVLAYADNGTVLDINNNTTVANGALVKETISDGEMEYGGKNYWGYAVPYDNISTRTTIAFAKGTFKNETHKFGGNFNSAIEGDPTEVKVNSAVDMVSKEGSAYRAEEGGKVTVTKGTRAGGYKSIIGYAEDSVSRVKKSNNETYTTMKGTETGYGSSVIINGNIVAADNMLFSTTNDSAGANTNTGPVNGRVGDDTKYAYQNIAAYALNGGDVIIKGATKSASTKEAANSDKSALAAANSSLIYGLAGYASGTGSNVIYQNSKITTVTGTDGALYATNGGYVEYAGDIVHQNNIGVTRKTGAATDGATIGVGETRGGRGSSTLNGGVRNDHTNVPVFYARRTTATDDAGITFNNTTNIDMYDGYFLTGNEYHHRPNSINNFQYNSYSDYYKEATRPSAPNDIAWDRARYRGMSKVTLNLVSGGEIDLGLINQAEKELNWGSHKDGDGSEYLASIGEYAGGMTINNKGTSNKASTSTATKFNSTIINSELKIGTDVELENFALSNGLSGAKSVSAGSKVDNTAVDPFNNIKMESTKVTIDTGKNVYGDIGNSKVGSLLAGQGLSMANSLYRWDILNKANSNWVKTDNTKSGYVNKGTISLWGGTKDSDITGVNVAYGTISNESAGKVIVDHGKGIVGTDDSILTNKGKIFVTGKYNPITQETIASTGATNAIKARTGLDVETKPTGKNYGIVGISTNNVTEHSNYGGNRYGNNRVTIENKDGIVEVDGQLAVGIYAANVNQSGSVIRTDEHAQKSNVTISYDNQNASQVDAIRVNHGAGGTADTATQKNTELRGVGIALVEKDKDANPDRRGGIITLNTKNNGIGGTADILTYQNGIGIYGESADIRFKGDSTGLTVDTGSNGAGIWATDDSTIATSSDRLGTPKTLNYNYKGYNDKKGFGMILSSTMSNTQTKAKNYLDIKFNNNGDTNLTLAVEKAQTSPGTINPGKGTTRGIAGMLVNTDANDSVYNYGNIKEDTSKTNVRSYGAIVNRGRLVNYGNIELNDSLNVDASSVDKADLKKVNAGIMANDHTTAANTWIENYGDIKVGTTSRKNIGGFGIYGYNIITGEKADHTTSTITVNSNSYGIYSGDGTVEVRKGTKLLVGNDTVLGHVQTTTGKAITTNPSAYPINRQTAYSQASELLPGRQTDAAYGVYIGDNSLLSGRNRNVEVSADMDIDRYSYGIVLAKNSNAEAGGTNGTTVKIGDGSYTLDAKGKVSSLTPTNAPSIVLAANKNAGGLVVSTPPSNPKVPEEVYEQGNAVYYYSADKNSKASSFANVTMNGDYNTAYYTAGSVDNFGTIDLRSQNNLLTVNGSSSAHLGYGNLGIVSTNPNVASTNYGTIITSMSDTENQKYSAGMAAGRNIYNDEGKFVRTEDEGYVVNRGTINVKEKEGIGMFATGARSKAVNYGTINLQGKNAIGMYLDRGAQGENYGTITGDAEGVKGVVAINNGYIKNYGTIKVTGTGSVGIITDNLQAKTDNEDSGTNQYKGTEEGKTAAIKYVASGNVKTTGVGTTITVPDTVPLTKVSVDGIDTPVFDVESDAANTGQWAKNITVSSSIQTGGTRIIDLNTKDEWGNPAWPHHKKPQLSEVTSIGMYVDTSGVRYTNPIDGIQNLPKLSEVNLYFGPEATLYTNSKAIRIGDKVDANGNVTKSNILKPFNDALSKLPGGAIVNPLSASLTWQVKAKLDANNQLSEVYMSKVPYHSFAFDDDKSLVNFTNNLDNIYEIARPGSPEKIIFNKLNSLGNGEGHILAQAFDQMRGHIYGGVQQRIKATSDIIGGEIKGLRNDSNGSKDSNKFKAFGQRNEFKTDTAGMPDWYSNAGG